MMRMYSDHTRLLTPTRSEARVQVRAGFGKQFNEVVHGEDVHQPTEWHPADVYRCQQDDLHRIARYCPAFFDVGCPPSGPDQAAK
jgi:hypothetical protein